MSGIIGILHLDGAPVDRQLVQRLTEFQSFRGPDAQYIWVGGSVGFGHTLLKTTEEPHREQQPFTLGDDIWIVADARVDARRDLIGELQAHGHTDLSGVSDVDLILRSYQVWGEDCIDHLLGDFAFGIWDGPRQKLFCARDQMGIKCLYYAHIGPLVIFSNTLDCIRQHPAVSDRLNDLAIADFLLFEMNLDQATTSFADIQRLPPAHKTVWSRDGRRQSRYWTMPIEEPVFYKRAADYTDRFKELMSEAVGDRLRSPRVGILMSGGLDSPSLAAVASELSRKRVPKIELKAFTTITKTNPTEGYFAGLVAQHLKIPIELCDWEDECRIPNWEQTSTRTSQPVANVDALTMHYEYWRHMGSFGRVFLQGEGPDNALIIDWKPYVSYLLRKRRYARLFLDSCQYLAWHRRIPFWGRISKSFHGTKSEASTGPSFPEWINKNLESGFELRERWDKFYSPPPSVHPVRPMNYALLAIPGEFQELFRLLDAETTCAATEVRFPYMDLRVLRYFLTVPSIPWCRDKYLLRRAMKNTLPDSVLHRRKGGVSNVVAMKAFGKSSLAGLKPAARLSAYVDVAKLPNAANHDEWALGTILRAHLLNHWLQNSYRIGYSAVREAISK